MDELAKQECVRSGPDATRLEGESLTPWMARLVDGWQLCDGRRLRKRFTFEDFAGALAFVNRVGEMAEEQHHHPDMMLRWGEVVVEIWTHTVDGLVESDFVFAAKAEKLHIVTRGIHP